MNDVVPLFTLGPWLWATLAVVLAAVLLVTGFGLLFFYSPSAGAAESLVELRQASAFGFLRDLHFWAAQGLVIAAWLHMTRVFAAGSYRRRLGWRVTVALVALVTLQTFLGGRLAAPSAEASEASLLAVYAAHVVFLPLALTGLLVSWAGLRSGWRRPASPDDEDGLASREDPAVDSSPARGRS